MVLNKTQTKTIETMAKAGFERMFEDRWDALHSNSIERSLWIEIVKEMLKSVNFPTGLYQICYKLQVFKVKED